MSYVIDSVYEGYFFCAELMPADHELQLMLVNTLRKARLSISIPFFLYSLKPTGP